MFKTCIEAQYIVQTAEYEDHLGIHTFHQQSVPPMTSSDALEITSITRAPASVSTPYDVIRCSGDNVHHKGACVGQYPL